jgi:hypothetical protein
MERRIAQVLIGGLLFILVFFSIVVTVIAPTDSTMGQASVLALQFCSAAAFGAYIMYFLLELTGVTRKQGARETTPADSQLINLQQGFTPTYQAPVNPPYPATNWQGGNQQMWTQPQINGTPVQPHAMPVYPQAQPPQNQQRKGNVWLNGR